jgi:hypothetical protein
VRKVGTFSPKFNLQTDLHQNVIMCTCMFMIKTGAPQNAVLYNISEGSIKYTGEITFNTQELHPMRKVPYPVAQSHP